MRVVNFCPLCGKPTEQQDRYGRIRPVCTACGNIVFFTPQVAVLALITQDDQVLLIKRAYDPGKGHWAVPAGFVEFDENPVEAAQREVLEETGFVIGDLQLMDVFGKFDDDGKADIVIAYRATITGGTLFAADDAEEVRWFARGNLPEVVFRTTEIVLERWINGN